MKEEHLRTIENVDLDTNDAQPAFIVPLGKRLLLTRAYLRDATVPMANGGTTFFRVVRESDGAVLLHADMSAAGSEEHFVIAVPSTTIPGRVVSGGDKLLIKFDSPYGVPATAIVDLYGSLISE